MVAGHTDLLRAYFGILAYGGAAIIAGGLAAWVDGSARPTDVKGWVTRGLVVLSTWGAFRTRRLLAAYDRAGAWTALSMLGFGFLAAWSAGLTGVGSVVAGIGILLALNGLRGLK